MLNKSGRGKGRLGSAITGSGAETDPRWNRSRRLLTRRAMATVVPFLAKLSAFNRLDD